MYVRVKERKQKERIETIKSNGYAVAEWNINGGFDFVAICYFLDGADYSEEIDKREIGIPKLKELIQHNVIINHIGEPVYRNKIALNMV